MASELVLVLFDADCGICTRTARILRAFDRRQRLELVPFAEAERRGLAAELPRERFLASFHAISNGRTLSGPDAIPVVLQQLPGGRLPARLITRIPLLFQAVARAYAAVSRNRYRFGACKCEPPSPNPPKGGKPPKEPGGP